MLQGNASNPGILAKYANNTGALQDNEKAFITNLPGGMGTMYRNLSLSSPKTASLFAIDTSAILALTLAYNLAESLIQSTLAANLNSDTPYKKEVVMLLERSRESLREEYRTLSNNYGRLSEVVAKYNDLIKNQRSQQYVLNIVGDQSSKEVENEVTGGKS